MGNQLVNSVKVVIRPIDYYLSEEYKFKCSLGQTQFLKVALCRHAEGDVVVKVLSHEDPSLLLEQYKRQLEAFAKLTAGNVSIASFRQIKICQNFAFIVRQFVRFSLYDRLSTRPFLTHLEKCWIVYQMFKCMAWCHEKGICHGDLKLENILVTSSLWIVISDFATYKPVSLPEDNPSFFNYFFDTSRRRCCNIAPERFVSSSLTQLDLFNLSSVTSHDHQSSNASFVLLNDTQQLTDKMDMFSIGCTLAEVFSENVLFDLSGLLHYKDGKKGKLEFRLKQIDDETIRNLVVNLTSLNPCSRKSCDQVLSEQRGKLFPTHFDKLYVLMRTLVRLPPDAKILYLLQELEVYLPMILTENSKSVLILLTMVTSSMRSLKHIYCKIEAQRLICRLVASAPSAMSPFITDRLIPYFANYLHDTDHRVRGEAILCMTQLLEQVTRPPASDNNIFTDYLLGIIIKHISTDKSTHVRMCLAKCIGRLSKTALHFLNQSVDHNYDEELNLLHNYFQTLVSLLLTDSNNCVRRTLLLTPENCLHLCTFFGRQKTNEVILSHIITFLNDKDDFQLRLSFFDNIIIIASFLGVQCAPILYPLLQQGLCDAEEIIISKSIDAIALLAEQGLLQKNIIYELVKEILPLLYHPNQWITHSIVHLFTTLAQYLSFIDLSCKMVPMMSPYLSRPIHSFTSKYLLLDSLKRPLPRNVYDIAVDILDYKSIESLFRVLVYRHQLRRRLKPNSIKEMDAAAYRRLLAENINDNMEEQLLKLSELVSKIHRNKRNHQMPSVKRVQCGNVIQQRHFHKYVRSVKLVDSLPMHQCDSLTANQEWQHMFGPRSKMSFFDTSTIVEGHEAIEIENYFYFECPPYRRDVKLMLMHKKNCFTPMAVAKKANDRPLLPKGFLVSHLQEHKAPINQMARAYGETNCFFTCSDDGTIRLWDLSGFENRYVINRSKYLFKMEFSNGSLINFKGIVSCGQYLITYTNEGIVIIFESNNKFCLSHVCSFKAGSSRRSVSPMITSLTALSSTLFAVSLTDCFVYCYDTRILNCANFFVPVFKLRVSPNQQTITSIDGAEVALFAGTATGHIAAFDLRFHLNVNYFDHSTPTRIARLVFTPEGLFSSVYGNSEVIIWDYKLGQRQRTLKPHLPADNHGTNAAINAILPISSSTSVITGGSDMRIRYWDLNRPESSYIISDPSYKACNFCLGNPNQPGHKSTAKTANTASSPTHLRQQNSNAAPSLVTYIAGQDAADQSLYIQEIDCSSSFGQFQAAHYCTVDQQFVSTSHHNTITDLLQVNQYLVSAGRNGTVKVWR